MAKTLVVAYNISTYEARYYSTVFYEFSDKYDVPWEIYPALIRIESNFKPGLRSSKGAKGLMQILEGTGRDVARKIGVNFIPEETLWNETLNLVIGMTYLTDAIKRDTTESDSSALAHGIKTYLGGPDYVKALKEASGENAKYIGVYKSTVWDEYTKLRYIYKGVQFQGIKQ